jgi:beta-N-acetylhexosaminidase
LHNQPISRFTFHVGSCQKSVQTVVETEFFRKNSVSSARFLNMSLHVLRLLLPVLVFFAPIQLFALTDAAIDELVDRMTAEQKVGQLLIVGFEGKTVNKTVKAHISQRFVGGVILFDRNIQSPRQVARLTNELQQLARETPHQIPLLIGTDQEGGGIIRMKKGATVLPGNMALGATGSTELAERAGKITATELAAVGMNLNFAPVMDVNSNPHNPVIGRRSFGESPELVSRLGAAYIQGLQRHGVLATAKHFPGHGDTTVDSHTDLPTVNHKLERIHAVELKPFRAAIDAGVAAIMTAHIRYTTLDASCPATLSPKVLTQLLRDELKFDGIIITDDMAMKAIDARYPAGEAAVLAVEAGADMILTPGLLAKQRQVYNALLSAVKSGKIPEARLNQSVRRILKGKRACGAFDRGFVEPDMAKGIVGNPEHEKLAKTIASQAITVVRNRDGVVPLKLDEETKIVVMSRSRTLFNLFQRRHANSSYTKLPDRLDSQLIRQADDTDFVIASIVNDKQAHLIHQLSSATQTPIIVIAFASPYPLNRCPNVAAALAAYDGHYASVLGAVEVILGRIEARGTLPVKLMIEN